MICRVLNCDKDYIINLSSSHYHGKIFRFSGGTLIPTNPKQRLRITNLVLITLLDRMEIVEYLSMASMAVWFYADLSEISN